MTATEKIYNYNLSKLCKNEQGEILSMDNKNMYGNVIYNYSTKNAIEDKQLVDYKIIAPFIITNNYKEIAENNNYVEVLNDKYEIKMIMLGLTIVEMINKKIFKHLLIFSNKNKRAKEILEIIKILLNDDNIYCEYLNGTDNMNKRRYNIKLFENSERGIISSARIFGEGVNIPICDAVCFLDNKCSTVDIVQYVGRCLRKCDSKPNKLSYILIPFILDEKINFFDNENKSFLKLRKILRSLGTTDETVTEKFSLKHCSCKNLEKYDEKEYNEYIISGKRIKLEEFKQNIITKIFDRSGNQESRIRNKIIYENKRRIINNLDLIDAEKKCLEFLKSEFENEIPNPKNWVKYCLGNELFDEIKKKYYEETELIKVFEKHEIKCYYDYVKTTNDKLPSMEYINSGFYNCKDDCRYKFNLNKYYYNNNDFF